MALQQTKKHKQYYYNVGPFQHTYGTFEKVLDDNGFEIGVEAKDLIGNNESIIQLGIQAPPGTPFELDQSKGYIGKSGIFELNDKESALKITTIKFYGTEKIIDINKSLYEESFKILFDGDKVNEIIGIKDNINNLSNFIKNNFYIGNNLISSISIEQWNQYYDAYAEFITKQNLIHNNFIEKLQGSYTIGYNPCHDIIIDVILQENLNSNTTEGGAL